MPGTFDAFITRWSASAAAERANKDSFLNELCEVLGVPKPEPSTGDPARDEYVFERKVQLLEEDGLHVKSIDLYKACCFILEAKQGSEQGSRKLGSAKRGTEGWTMAMRDAFGQALNYAKGFDTPPPFIVVADIGYCFDLYAAFDGTWSYRPFPNAQTSRIFLTSIEKNADLLRRVWTDPLSLDPARQSQRVTREVAAHLAGLAKALEDDGHDAQAIAKFLMRCIFTMFAEDVGLLPARLFTNAVKDLWLPSPPSFPNGIRSLWKSMNEGTDFGFVGRLLRFNGGLFARQDALPLKKEQLALLLEAANCDWADVEPAIFGTLLERALDKEERHALGAHFTPKAYVERLVRPTIEEPLRADWDVVQAHVRQLVAQAEEEDGKRRKELIAQARGVVHEFHAKLCAVRVLDPACGSGNFLYVTLDLFKRLEGEALALLQGLGETQTKLDLSTVTVNPSQFLGIEVKPWAKEIAELVLWIGYLQWHFRTYGRGEGDKKAAIPEPVLRDYGNIECRDAVLAYDSEELLLDEHGKPVTRWDGESTKKHPVTGEDVPDETRTIPVYRYVNPRKAEWPKADFIVGNPPFIGNKRMRDALGDGYVEALRHAYDDVSDTVDYVMYWWHKAAELVRAGQMRRFGLITTNSITQTFSRKVLQAHMNAENPLSLVFAIPNHPWVDSTEGAAVRVAMTAASAGSLPGTLMKVTNERESDDGIIEVSFSTSRGRVHSDLTVGANVADAVKYGLLANQSTSFMGVTLVGKGFIVEPGDALVAPGGPASPFFIGRDLNQFPEAKYVIDFFGMSAEEAQSKFPAHFQRVVDRVKPEREQNSRQGYRDKWWLFAEQRTGLRKATGGLARYIATCRTASHRVFQFVPGDAVVESTVIAIAVDDAFALGTLSSRIHVLWATQAGTRLGVGNDPRYNNSVCFEPFPFPVCADEQKQRIRDLGEALDAHRKARQAEHPDLTITGMYNVLTKLRSGEALNAKEKVIHEKGLVSVLKKIHDDLDAAVFAAYGWPPDLTDEQILERLVALNAERAEEERRGLIRWLRPEYQMRVVKGAKAAVQTEMEIEEPAELVAEAKPKKRGRKPKAEAVEEVRQSVEPPAPPENKPPWPKTMPEQIAAVRDLVLGSGAAWTAEAVARSFKFARAGSVEPVLDSLAAIGVLAAYESKDGRKWKAAGRG
ncbi:MAG: class I SAM-dependent DNA methyltransferase [Deltaproteobacteria bacterium]|nr:class I SAM-dependent DNA methyltransferase [Deltaproteobacteria bacterium]